MLMIGDRLNSYTIAAGEPWIMSVQMRAFTNLAVIDWSQRRLVLSFYDGASQLVDQIEGVYSSDASGAYFAFVRDGLFSTALSAKSGVTVELAERLKDGRAIIATGPLTIARSSPGVTTFGSVIGRVESRFKLYFDEIGLLKSIEQDLLPYVAGGVPAPAFTTPASISSDGTPQVGETLTGVDGVVTNGTVTGRAWLLGSTTLATTQSYAPTATGVHTYRVTATGPGGTTQSSTSINVGAATPAPTPVTISGTPPPTGQVGQAYSFTPTAANGAGTKAFALASGTLLGGLSFSTTTGAISGTPNVAGTMSGLSVRVTDDSGSAATTPTNVTIAAAPATGDEAVISPPVTTARSTYAFSDVGVIQRKPAGMPGFGPYWGSPPKNYTTGANDVANDPFWGPLGFKWLSYYSTDHDGEGGIWLSMTRNADPKVIGDWMTYDQALAAGHFASVTTKPASNPIYKHGAGLSTETPQVIKIGDDWAMFYQTYSVNGAINQCTNRILGRDGLNWNGDRTAPWLIFTGNESGQMGDGHTGYGRPYPNPFDKTRIPFDWLIPALAGGTAKGMYGMWGTNDPIRGAATFIQTISPQRGRLGLQSGLYCADGNSAVAVRQGIAVLGGGLTQSGSGLEVQRGNLHEYLFDPTGTEIIAAPNQVMPMPLNADVSDLAAIPTLITRDTERLVMFQGTRVPTDGSNKVNVTALATSPRRNKENTWFAPLDPAVPTNLTVRDYDFRIMSAFPAGLTLYNPGNVTHTFDPTFGLDSNVGTTGATRDYAYFWEGVNLSTLEMIEFYLWDQRSRGTTPRRTFGMGFWVAAAGAALVGFDNRNGLLVRNGGTGGDGAKGYKLAGVDTMNDLSSYPTLSTGSNKTYGRKNIGMRWFVQNGTCEFLGEGALIGGVETESITVPPELKPGGSMFNQVVRPWFGMKKAPSEANQEQTVRARARWA